MQNIYKTTSSNLYWTFNSEYLTFNQIDSTIIPTTSTITSIDNNTILKYNGTYFIYNGTEWTTTTTTSGFSILDAKFNNIAKYQTNMYYYYGNFSYNVKGDVEGSTTQYIKGLINPLETKNIQSFEDIFSNIKTDDLIVCDNHLYMIENITKTPKRQPKNFYIYSATINSII